jgi:predicted ribosome quality control (RQC) complex YloA/Tae2 family protein
MKNKNLLKFITISFFLIFIFSVPIITLFTEDKKISEIENKILTQLPRISFENICNKKFMKNFDEYTSDQFPLRANFIKLKNTYNYIIGQREFRDIYVGKNNYQNDELTFKFATGNDWWFHAKGMPGSHVIVKSNNEELPDRVFEEAGMLAGYYSKGREDEKVEIDYLQKKNVKKPNGAAPGFVVYYTNYSLTIHPDISGLTLVSD